MARSSKKNESQINITAKKLMQFSFFMEEKIISKRYDINQKKNISYKYLDKQYLQIVISVLIQYFTGLRINEIARLTRNQLIDLKNGKNIKVEISKKRKVADVRVVSISYTRKSRGLFKILQNFINRWVKLGHSQLVISKNMEKSIITVRDSKGNSYKTYIYRYINNFTTKVNKYLNLYYSFYNSENDDSFLPSYMEKMTSHVLRNNFIVSMYKIHRDIVVVQNIIHHSSIEMTAVYISKFLETEFDTAM